MHDRTGSIDLANFDNRLARLCCRCFFENFSCSTLPPIPEHRLYNPSAASQLDTYGSRYLGKVTLQPGDGAQDVGTTRETGSTNQKVGTAV